LDLFSHHAPNNLPLAARMRPATLEEYVGQDHLVGSGAPIAQAIAADQIHSMIFWGPPGCGKTTLAQLISHETKSQFLTISAVTGGVKDIRNAVSQAEMNQAQGLSTILFIDEIHRFNKSQQDALLPYVEEGLFVLIGATTENPSFELNNALLSRARVYIIKPIAEESLLTVIDRALADEKRGVGSRNISFDEDTRQILVQMADGDARRLLNLIEVVANHFENQTIAADEFIAVAGEKLRQFDKGGEYFYDQISALHKSVRGSDPDAALYWMCRMLDGGVDPNYVARRLVRMASEDIGNADPRALDLANNAWDALLKLGPEEGNLALAQAALYLAAAPKSNAVYMAYKQAMADVKSDGSHDVPVHLRNAPTKLMKELGYGKSYQYAHDFPDAYVPNENYWPESKAQVNYYQPVNRGLEIQIEQKLQRLRDIDGKN
jgi:putative ATPase